MRLVNYALWRPRRAGPSHCAELASTDPTVQEGTKMADGTEFEIASAILTAALIEKSELKEKELEAYAVNIHRLLIRHMMAFRDLLKSERTQS